MQMTIDLSNKQAEQFQQLAKSLSIPPQELEPVLKRKILSKS